MNKKQFIKKLMSKLEMLNEIEKEDIITEYSGIIDEKIKSGMSEKEAIADFGTVDELAKEILKAYKLNPDYEKKENSESFDETVKRGATWLGDKTKEFFEGIKGEKREITVEKVFEIVIKIFIVLIILNVLRLPFNLVSSLGQGVFAGSIFPFYLLKYVWIFVIEISYILVVALLIFLIFKDNLFATQQEVKSIKKKDKKASAKKGRIVEKKQLKYDSQTIIMVAKVLIFICFIVPLALFSFSLVSGLAIGLYLIFKGVFFYGPVLLIVGTLIFVFHLMYILSSIFEKKQIRNWPFLISFIIVLTGLLLTIDWVIGLDIKKEEPKNLVEESLIIDVKDFNNRTSFFDYEMLVNPDVEDDKIMVKIYFDERYQDFVHINEKGISIIRFSSLAKFKQYNDQFIEDLKNDKLYIPYYQIEIHAQESTINKIEKKNF